MPMKNNSHMTSRIKGLSVAFVIIGSLGLSGCHDWPDERATAIEAQNILRELNRIDTVPDPNIPIPDIYKTPPKKIKHLVGGAEEWRLFYYCQYHTAEEMKKIIHEQFSSRIFDAKGKSQTLPNFGITANPSTNQVIARCPAEADVDAIMEVIKETDVPPIQVRIECMVSEMYADLTVDRETTLEIENLFGEGIRLGGKRDTDGVLLPAFPGAALRDPARERLGLKVGVSRGEEGHRFEALVDILVSRGYLKILMNPILTVVNGQPAMIQAKEHVPLQQIFLRGGYGDTHYIETKTEYTDIIDMLRITPHVYADGYIGLETEAQISAYLTPEGIKQLPILTERTISNKDNRIRHGESLIIGGIRKAEKRDVIRGVPILKDIPGLNLLFSGRDFEERAKEVIFIITPTISTGGKPNKDVVEMMRERHSSPMTQALHEAVLDPLGIKARDQEQERQLEEARDARQQSEAEKTKVRIEVMETGQQIESLQTELQEAKTQVEEADSKAEAAASKAEEAKAEAQKATTEAQQAKTEAQQAKSEAEKAQAEAREAKEKADEPKDQPPGKPAEVPKEQAPNEQSKEESKPQAQEQPATPEK